jgi:hypothetical protein
MKYTSHYLYDTLSKRPYLKESWLIRILEKPMRKEVQLNGRIKYWGYVEEIGKYFRVVTLEDGKTVHTAFPDRNFKE